jgi:enamine deaminase RidA (YjgF/YER057c/UK114 family)
MEIESSRLEALGLVLGNLEADYTADESGAKFVSHLAVGEVLYLSGTIPERDGRHYLPGVVGADLTLEQGYEAARYAALSSLTAARFALGDLGRVRQIIQVIGWVNSAPGFSEQPRVINGATDLLVEVFGERGRSTRAAIGCQGLALGASVELVCTIQFDGGAVREPLRTRGLAPR